MFRKEENTVDNYPYNIACDMVVEIPSTTNIHYEGIS